MSSGNRDFNDDRRSDDHGGRRNDDFGGDDNFSRNLILWMAMMLYVKKLNLSEPK